MTNYSSTYIPASNIKMSDVSDTTGLTTQLRTPQTKADYIDKINYKSICMPKASIYGNTTFDKSASRSLYHTNGSTYIGGHGLSAKCGTVSMKGAQQAGNGYASLPNLSLNTLNLADKTLPSAPSLLSDWAGYRHADYKYSDMNEKYTQFPADIPFYFEVKDIAWNGANLTVNARYATRMADIVKNTITAAWGESIKSGYIGLSKMINTYGCLSYYLGIGINIISESYMASNRPFSAVRLLIPYNNLIKLDLSSTSTESVDMTWNIGSCYESTASNYNELNSKNKLYKGEKFEIVPLVFAVANDIPLSSTATSCKYIALPCPQYSYGGGESTRKTYCRASGKIQINYLQGKWYFGVKQMEWRPNKSYGTTKPDGSYYYFTAGITIHEAASTGTAYSGQSVIEGRIQSYNVESRTEESISAYVSNQWQPWSNAIGKMYPTTSIQNSGVTPGTRVKIVLNFLSPDNEPTISDIFVELPTNTNDTVIVDFFV